MKNHQADQFEAALQQAAQGGRIERECQDLVNTSRRLTVLAGTPPQPPHRLAPGRQRLLAEAAQLRASRVKGRKMLVWLPRPTKLATTLVAIMLVMSSVLGVGHVAAASLPGEALYGVKLAAEQVRLELTAQPEARMELTLDLAEKRLDEIVQLMDDGQVVDQAVVERAEEQLALALRTMTMAHGDDNAPSWAHVRLLAAIQKHRRTVESAALLLPEDDQTPVRGLLREMDRVRLEIHGGDAEPAGAQERHRLGTPPEAEDLPEPPAQPGADLEATPGPAGPHPDARPGLGASDSDAPGGAGTLDPEKWTPGPHRTAAPLDPEPTEPPGNGPRRWSPAEESGGPAAQPSPAPGQGEPQATPVPAGPGPSGTNGPDDAGSDQGQSSGNGGNAGGKGRH